MNVSRGAMTVPARGLCRPLHPVTTEFFEDAVVVRDSLADHRSAILRARYWQVNEGQGVRNIAVSQLAKNRDYTQNPSMSEMASLEKSGTSIQTGGWHRTSFHASL
jgi:hypothetical protein